MTRVGQLLPDRYRRPRLIGRGGMGEIYHARDTSLGRAVVVKVLAAHHAENEEMCARFLREALAAARLTGGPHTVTIYDVGEWQGRPYIVMEYLGGGSLAERLARGLPPRAQAVEWLEQTAAALDAAHEQGVIHRDVKPANLLLDTEGNVRVADFGIASAAGLDSTTQTGTVLGTAGYISPEQAAGGRATPASDRYALAVVAHELLTGARPGAVGPKPLATGIEAVFAQALAHRPESRFDSCAELVGALRAALTEIEPPTVVMRRRRRPAIAAAAALGAVGALAALLTTTLGADGPSPSPPAPRPPTTRAVVPTVTVPTATPRATPAAVQPHRKGHHGKPEHRHGKKEKD
jgi:serine/threonine protein kinase